MAIDVSSLDEAVRGHITTAGWDQLEPPAALAAVVGKWREAETKLGGPADELVRIPKGADAAALAPVYEKLGVPKEAAGYEFKDVQAPDELRERVRQYAVEHKLTQGQANALLTARAAEVAGADKSRLEGIGTAVQVATQALDSKWGTEAPMRKFHASKVMEHFGLTADDLATFSGSDASKYVGYMEKFAALGVRMAEAKIFDGTLPGGSSGALTPDQARAKISALNGDASFIARRMHDDEKVRYAAAEELMQLERLARGIPLR